MEVPFSSDHHSWSPSGRRLLLQNRQSGLRVIGQQGFRELSRHRYELGGILAPLPKGHRLVSSRWRTEQQLICQVSAPGINYWLSYSLDSLAWHKSTSLKGPFEQIVTPLRQRFGKSVRPTCQRSADHKTLSCEGRVFKAPKGELVGDFRAGRMPYVLVRTYAAEQFADKSFFLDDGIPQNTIGGYVWGLNEGKQRKADFVQGQGQGRFERGVWSRNGRWVVFYSSGERFLSIFNQADLKVYLEYGTISRLLSLPVTLDQPEVFYFEGPSWEGSETVAVHGGCCGVPFVFRYFPCRHQWSRESKLKHRRRR